MPRPSVEAERRAQILAATCKAIARTGIAAFRVADVAKEAGLSPGIVHYYFDTKQELIRAAFEHNFLHSLERRAAIFESGLEPVEKLRALVEAYLPQGDETVEAWHVWAELWVTALHDAELRDLNDRAYGEWRRIVASIVRECQAAGRMGDEDPVDVANMLVGLLDGLALQVLVGSHAMTLRRMRATCRAFIDGLVASS
ncbi:TetR/AcrR family transcriptional regulator [Streptomyces sp. NPDC053427]|uniref:TetR/AcrR family transcriptional regulator n=1 Tax=Streptomyces sp. NPDC053427 TaxID=3365701 RepID=UPI0037D6ECB0